MTDLKITNSLTEEERHVCHFQFTSWPDYGTPDSALSMLQFLQVSNAGGGIFFVLRKSLW